MIDLQDLRDRPDVYKKTIKNKGLDADVDAFLKLDDERKELLPEVEQMRAAQNEANKKIPSLKGDEKEKMLSEMKSLSSDLKKKEEKLRDIEEKWKSGQLGFPSIQVDKVPVGKDESENVEVSSWGDKPKFDFEPQDHVALGEALDIVDIPRGVKISGARSYFLKGEGARLHHAVLRFTMDHLVAKGWNFFVPPLMANWDCLMGTGFFPGAEEQTYEVGASNAEGTFESDNAYLIGTSEVSVCSYHKDEILSADELPKRYAGYSACFRREAGTYGKDTKGLYRVHQFDKVEQVIICKADEEESRQWHQEMIGIVESLLQQLELPYRLLQCCTADLGAKNADMIDIECWMPARGELDANGKPSGGWGETHSASRLYDYQCRRLNMRYRDEDGQTVFAHSLNNTVLASPRILIPLLEMHQQQDGSVNIPTCLQPYMHGISVLEPCSVSTP